MMITRDSVYDEVYDSQKHFRVLLDAMARPGKVVALDPVELNAPEGIDRASLYICLSLLNQDATYASSAGSPAVEAYLKANVGTRAVALEQADFILAQGSDSPALLELAKEGILTYPETASTIVIKVDRIAHESFENALRLDLEGPGIKGRKSIYVSGWSAEWARGLAEKNSEFPLGVDAMLVFEDESRSACVCCLPRSTRIAVA